MKRHQYRVEVLDTGSNKRFTKRGLSLAAAWRYARQQAEKGVKLYGGSLHTEEFGIYGGQYPDVLRSANIRLNSDISG